MRRPDLSLTVRQRKLACVLDPALALCHAQGPLLAQRLTQVVEPWLTRSFWQVLDASELLLRRQARDGVPHDGAPQPVASALTEWIRLRDCTDAGSWTFRWIGDCIAESQVQDATDMQAVERYETLAEALARRLTSECGASAWMHGYDPVAGALDTLILSATLGGAIVLSQDIGIGNVDPWPVQALARVGVSATCLQPLPAESLFAAERALLRDALAAAGLAPVLEQLPPLIVLHVVAADGDGNTATASNDEVIALDPWAGARAWWYRA